MIDETFFMKKHQQTEENKAQRTTVQNKHRKELVKGTGMNLKKIFEENTAEECYCKRYEYSGKAPDLATALLC